ncbi:hypothetical protein AN958_01305 [Leucoagaricus sp. SymC.cos]|nr:hypothetical protein AN958_01305 [Leucoagaricus sp. SymC.cos]
MDANFTPEMKKLASEKLIFALNTECSKVRQGNRLNLTYSENLDAFGANLEIDISSDPQAPDIRKWSVSVDYRSKNDAKLAVCYHAVSQGAIEILRFKGVSPPPDYVSYWDVVHGKAVGARVSKRKSAETEISGETCNQQKKRKKEGQKIYSEVSRPLNNGQTDNTTHQSPGIASSGTKRSGDKRPLNTRLQELNGSSAADLRKEAGGHPLPMNQGIPESFPVHQTPYYPPPQLPGPHYPFSPYMLTPTGTPSPMYYQTSPSPVTYPTYHPHSAMPEPHTPMYHPPFVPAYPQTTVSPYYAMPPPYHSPYAYPSLSPLHLPSTPDGRMMDIRDYRPEMYHSPLPHLPLHPMSPPSTPPRPQWIKRIDRNAALSPLRMAENFVDLEEVGAGNENGPPNATVEKPATFAEKDAECLEPGELTEGEGQGVSEKSQILERRASMP